MKKSANRSFLRVCRQRTILSLGKFSESAIGEWEFSQSLPTENYVVIGRVLRVCQESRKTTDGVFPESANSELRGHWASSQTLPRKQNRRLGVFSESADSELRGHWGEISDSAKKAESANGSFLRVCRWRTMGDWGEISDSALKAE